MKLDAALQLNVTVSASGTLDLTLKTRLFRWQWHCFVLFLVPSPFLCDVKLTLSPSNRAICHSLGSVYLHSMIGSMQKYLRLFKYGCP